ncbi:TRAP transporter permease [Agromyces larvae]|uniref:TRAP transporter fused permease subunit n=1 Tax=Agromyces larvae TaxID=2929802 RepID=A0ABY4BWM7_9MICO|nr:TRAP transporter fused permease subunit [Agromyces larvae]UOE43632.1 TRAP transporter fused permease subunit [Agromyces larvae]
MPDDEVQHRNGTAERPALSDTPVVSVAPARTPDEVIAEFDEERVARSLPPRLDRVVTAYCFAVTLFVLYQVFFPLRQGIQFSLILFLASTLPLAFLLYRGFARRGGSAGPTWWDWTLTVVAAAVCLYPVLPFAIGDGGGGFDSFLDRQGSLAAIDVIAGAILTLLILEAARRTTGLVLPIFCLVFFAFAYYGGYLPMDWAISHAGVDFDQIINGFFNDQSGFFGTPLAVAASYIVLFIIYGAVLQATGAGRFFIDFSFSLFRSSRSAAGRTVVTSGFLLGTVSGSGTATAVTLGSLAWPVLRQAGYPKNPAGGVLAAAGIGAILSPPTLGAAAFIIAEYLRVSYLEVMIWAIIPTILYYVGIFIAVEIDARRFGAKAVDLPRKRTGWLLARFGYHFLSLAVIVLFLAVGLPPFRAIVYATAVAAAFGLIERMVSRRDPLDDDAVRLPLVRALVEYGRELYFALASGIRSAIPVVAVCAAAGIITSVIVKTGVGLSFARLLVGAAESLASDPQAILVITAVLAAFAVILLGLAVPVTASFIISWVIIGPALIGLGVERPEAAMFIFYYAVLSEVSPPTALAAVASAAITGGDTIRTMWQATKYTLPAFLAPLAIVLTPAGGSLLLQGDVGTSIWAGAVSIVAVAALAGATGGWVFARATWPERALLLVGAVFCLYLEPVSIAVGLACVLAGAALNGIRTGFGRHGASAEPSVEPSDGASAPPSAPSTALQEGTHP